MGPDFSTPMARAVRRDSGIPVIASPVPVATSWTLTPRVVIYAGRGSNDRRRPRTMRTQVNASRPVEAHGCSCPRPLVKHERNNASAVASVVARAQGAPETGGRPERRKQSLEPVAHMWHIRSEIRGDRRQTSTAKPQVRGHSRTWEQCFDRPSNPPGPRFESWRGRPVFPQVRKGSLVAEC